jgi:hypothetical protein
MVLSPMTIIAPGSSGSRIDGNTVDRKEPSASGGIVLSCHTRMNEGFDFCLRAGNVPKSASAESSIEETIGEKALSIRNFTRRTEWEYLCISKD